MVLLLLLLLPSRDNEKVVVNLCTEKNKQMCGFHTIALRGTAVQPDA